MAQPYINLGPLTLYYYGLFIFLGLLFVYIYLKTQAKKHQINPRQIESAFLTSLFFALLGARLYHVISSLQYYLVRPFNIFFFWEGGLGIFGAIVGGIAGLYLYCQATETKLINLLNLLAPPLLIAQAIGRVGNHFNFEGFGPPTNLPWKVAVPPAYRPPRFIAQPFFHPTYFYEALLCLAAFAFYLALKKTLKKNHFGFAYYLISYGLIRILTETFRIDTWRVGNLKIGYMASAAVILAGLFTLRKKA
jgi:phosphatidylglycerol:prolipoprotein diacylglycerol transferase